MSKDDPTLTSSKSELLAERIVALNDPSSKEAILARIREREAPMQLTRTGQIMTEAEDRFIRAAMYEHEAWKLGCGTGQMQAREEFDDAFKVLIKERRELIQKVGES